MTFKTITVASASAIVLLTACGGDAENETYTDTGPADTRAEMGRDDAGASEKAEQMSDQMGGMSGMDGMDGTRNQSMDNADNPDMTNEDMLAALQGDWLSGDDDRAEMSIVDGTVTMMYDGEVLSTDTLELVDSCPDGAAGPRPDAQLLTMTSTEAAEPLCYAILGLSDNRLELSSLPRGNSLTYTRQPMGATQDAQ
jgi:hypothetical protein